MRSKIAVIGGESDALTTHLADVVHVAADAWEQLAGADVVVLTAGADVAAAAAATARRAGGAVLVVATPEPEADTAVALAASLLPRPRVFGVAPHDTAAAAEAVVLGRDVELTVAAQVEAGGGAVELVRARVGAGGLRALG